ncbi:MAG: autotransporter outer membrane beta-barrel domain-containing protein [Phascolarctobacterium sp.]|nr:autotransporter outer membrane beta-barrel domain-containing protein [Phascolarctobacterium sp.]
MRKSLALGALMAFVITGSALAAEVEYDGTQTNGSGADLMVKSINYLNFSINMCIGTDNSNVALENWNDVKISGNFGEYDAAIAVNSYSNPITEEITHGNVDIKNINSLITTEEAKIDNHIIYASVGKVNIEANENVILKTDSAADPAYSDNGFLYADRGDITITAKNITIDAPNRTVLGADANTCYADAVAGNLLLKADNINITGSGNNQGSSVIRTFVGTGTEAQPVTPNSSIKLEGENVNIEATQGDKIAIMTYGGSVEVGQNEGFKQANIVGDIRSSYNEMGLFLKMYQDYYQEAIDAAETDEEKKALKAELDKFTDEMVENHADELAANAKVKVNLGEGGSLTGAITQDAPLPGTEGTPLAELAETTLGMGEGSTWNVTSKSALNNLKSNGGSMNLGDKALEVAIDSLSGESLNVITDNTDSKVAIGNKDADTAVSVTAGNQLGDSINDANQNEKLQELADVVDVAEGGNEKTIKVLANNIRGEITATTDENGQLKPVQEAVNETNDAVSDMASISYMTWRQENNDMNKRLGELRDSKGEHGAWARMARGESKYGAQGVKNQYNYYQVGYDEKLSTDSNWTVGVALTRTEGTSSFRNGSGENNHTGVAVYGSYLGENGSFLDLIAKYSRMDNEYKTVGGVGNADYETNGYSISAEYGKRFTKDNGLWIEPQIELTYGKVGSANYMTSNGANVRQDGMDSLVGRLGFALGKNIKAGIIYARASYLYDFDGDTDVTYSKAGVSRKFEQDLGGGWWEIGVGSNINLSDATHLYFDIEKTYGGDVATPWQWNVGVRYSF